MTKIRKYLKKCSIDHQILMKMFHEHSQFVLIMKYSTLINNQDDSAKIAVSIIFNTMHFMAC